MVSNESGYMQVMLPEKIVGKVGRMLKNDAGKELGVKDTAQFIAISVRKSLEPSLSNLTHLNTRGGHMSIIDNSLRRLGRTVRVCLKKDGGMHCLYCGMGSCKHVVYAGYAGHADRLIFPADLQYRKGFP